MVCFRRREARVYVGSPQAGGEGWREEINERIGQIDSIEKEKRQEESNNWLISRVPIFEREEAQEGGDLGLGDGGRGQDVNAASCAVSHAEPTIIAQLSKEGYGTYKTAIIPVHPFHLLFLWNLPIKRTQL